MRRGMLMQAIMEFRMRWRVRYECDVPHPLSLDDEESKKILRLSKAAAVASTIAFVICATHIYDASSEFGIYSDVDYVDAWHWWALQTIKRLEEVFACVLVLVIAFRKPCDAHCHVTNCFAQRKTHAEKIATVTLEANPVATNDVSVHTISDKI